MIAWRLQPPLVPTCRLTLGIIDLTGNPTIKGQSYFRKQIALPQDHGSWVFLLCPLIIGLFAGGTWRPASGFLVLAALAVFLARQPLTMAVKAWSGRRPRSDLAPAAAWTAVYGLLALVGLAGLGYYGYAYLAWLAVPGLPVFAWHMLLVSRREERRQMGVELIATGVLALAAPAAMWVGLGRYNPAGWWLFLLTWLQSAASIVYAYLRLEQRPLKDIPPLAARLSMARRALLYTAFNFFAVWLCASLGWLPAGLPAPFGLQLAETIYGTLRPAAGLKPVAIGARQTIVSTLFTILFVLTWRSSL